MSRFKNTKIIIISIILICMTIFNFRYIKSTISNNNELTNRIIKNERKLLDIYDVTINISRVDDEILSKCLDRDKGYHSLSDDISEIKELKGRLHLSDSIILDSLILEKEIVFNDINILSREKVNFEDVTSKRYILLNTKRSIFGKTKTEYKSYDYIDTEKLKSEYNRVNRKDYNDLNNLIRVNNDLTMDIRHIIDAYSKDQFILNVREYDLISKEINYNMTLYML